MRDPENHTIGDDGLPGHRAFITKDSGDRTEYASGMVRDRRDDKPRFDLIPLIPLRRVADLYARGAQKYGDSNWMLANSTDELDGFKASAFRHFISWCNGELDEDHGTAVVWNIWAYMVIAQKLGLPN